LTLLNREDPVEVQAAYISDNLFDTMGVSLQSGREFGPADQVTGKDQVVILSHHIWQREYGSSRHIIGDHIEIDQRLLLVIGIANPHQTFPSEADIWLPVSRMAQQDLIGRERKRVWAIGRLKPGVTEEQASVELRSIMSNLIEEYPRITDDRNVEVTSLLDHIVGDVRSILMLLLLAANLILVITCSNITCFFLAQASDRKLEVAVRSALGAPRGAIARQFLIEGILLSTIALFVGGFLSLLICDAIVNSADINAIFPRIDELSLDVTVVAYAGLITILSTCAFGVWPSLRGSRSDLGETLKREASPIGVAASDRTQTLLILGEVAISVVVLVVTTTLVASLWKLRGTDPGFRSDQALAIDLSLSQRRHPSGADVAAFYEQLLPRLSSLRGIEVASAANVLPLDRSMSMMHYGIDGAPARPMGEHPVAQIRIVAPGYFKLMGIPVTKGRTFLDSDARRGARPVYIVNEALARAHFRQEDPLTKSLVVVEAPTPFSVPIVGVVANVRDVAFDQQAEPTIYAAGFSRQSTLLVRVESQPLAFVDLVQREVQSVDRHQPLGLVSTMDELVKNALSQRELLTTGMGAFSFVALVLSSLGIFGVVAYSVAKRRSEIALRMALGADNWTILRRLVLRGMRPVVAGILVGLMLSWSLSDLLSGLLHGASLRAWSVYAFAAICTLGVSLLANAIPAIRAATMNPVMVMKNAPVS